MRNLIAATGEAARALAGRLRRDERGGIGVLIALLLSSGVLLGIAALVIDVGLLYAGQARLQNGADAAALAVARSCATGYCAPAAAGYYISANIPAAGTAGVSLVCGSGGLGPCPGGTGTDGSGTLTTCPPATPGRSYVDVSAAASASPGGIMPMTYARELLGSAVRVTGGGQVAACAQASWGPPAAATAAALTIPYCAWYLATSAGLSYAAVPNDLGTAEPGAGADVVLRLGAPATGENPGCLQGGAESQAGPGTFSWISDQAGACSARISGSYAGPAAGAGSGAPSLCERAIASAQASRGFLVIPVYATASGEDDQYQYQPQGFAAFVVTGYNLPGLSAPDWLSPAASCTGTTICVNGYFTRTLIPGTGTIGGQDLGARVAELTG